MNIYLVLVLVFIIVDFIKGFFVETLNMNHVTETVPEEFLGIYDKQKYKKSQAYLRDKTKFSLFQSTLFLPVILILILTGGFNELDLFVRTYTANSIVQGILFFALIILASQLIGLPFSYYDHFVLEERYGFNKMTKKIFFTDLGKSLLLMSVIGFPVIALMLWFFESTGPNSWLYCWLAISAIQIALLFLAPTLIMPLFNKFAPLEDGKLKEAIQDYAKKQNFALAGLFTMDGSKRSSKANAFFTGFGKYRRIVLFDTLIKNQSVDELVGILAHEMGHFKKKHILKMILSSLVQSLAMFYVLSLFLNNENLFSAFKMDHVSVYASLLFFGFLYSPISQILGIIGNIKSRKYEFEADQYAIETTHNANSFISALKQLSVDNLSNLTPHPLKVFLEYSHPPVIKRIEAIRSLSI
jgi:STE24 endopeptidase